MQLSETWDGQPGWHFIHGDHVAGSRFDSRKPLHAKVAKTPIGGTGYIGHVDDMGQITHHLKNGKPKSGKPWRLEK